MELSYATYAEYPLNLLWKQSSTFVLESQHRKFENFDAEPYPVLSKEEVVMFLTDITNGQLEAKGIANDVQLSACLGINSAILSGGSGSIHTNTSSGSSSASAKVPVFAKADPQCRLIYLGSNGNSRATLKITKAMLAKLLTFHQVTPQYLEFLEVFGFQIRQKNLYFTGFREYLSLNDPTLTVADPNLERSGKFFQLCYNLKSVGLDPIRLGEVGGVNFKARYFRQVAVHHQFDLDTGKVLWILTHGQWDVMKEATNLIGSKGRPEDKNFTTVETSLKSSLAMHLMLCRWATETWREYLPELEENVDLTTEDTAHAPFKLLTADDLVNIQALEEKTKDVLSQLRGNNGRLQDLADFYQRLSKDTRFPKHDTCKPAIEDFASNLKYLIEETKLQIERVSLLYQTISDRKELANQRLQIQSTTRMEHMSGGMYRETIAMRVLAVVSVLYLPGSFVSGFFSTDVIKYQQGGDQSSSSSQTTSQTAPTPSQSAAYMGSFSDLALNRWLQVTLPLTTVTVAIAVGIFICSKRRWDKERKDVKYSLA